MKKMMLWRLSQLPTGRDVAKLVEQKIITAKEAREILFRETEDSDDAKWTTSSTNERVLTFEE